MFKALEIPKLGTILSGRELTANDRPGSTQRQIEGRSNIIAGLHLA